MNLPVLLGLAAAVAAFLVAYFVLDIFGARNQQQLVRILPRYSTGAATATKVEDDVENSLKLLGIGRRVVRGSYLRFLQLKLEQSGKFGSRALEALLVRKVLFAGVGAGFGLLMFGRGLSIGAEAVVVLILLGFFVPDLLVVSAGQNRVTAIDAALPDAIDLLSLCVESGLSFEAAASRVSINMDGPVAEEFGAVLGEIQLGKSRAEALESLVNRTKSVGLSRFASAVLQVDRLGIPISSVLQEQASEMRRSRKDYAREQAQKVTVKILAPLMVCLLPAVFIVVIGPALVTLFTGLASIK
jgi:tight adherence protein C